MRANTEGELLTPGTSLNTLLGKQVKVVRLLGEGGQGQVYAVDYSGTPKALKWFKPNGIGEKPGAFYDNLKSNVYKGAPSAAFLWPEDIARQGNRFGYVMPLRPQGYHEITDFLLGQARFSSYRTVVDASLQIVSAFRLLHNAGYSYQDLNDGNFFVEPETGKVLICDNDNVAPNKTDTGIRGKPRFMAPEIVTQARVPDNLSDRFSMAVILFVIFCMDHPLEGRHSLVPALTPQLQERLYGSEALFIMDESNESNRPVPGVHKNVLRVWKFLPDFIQQQFQRAFCKKALTEPNARPSELEWIKTLVHFRSMIVPCTCGNEVFLKTAAPCSCENCRRTLSVPFKIQLREYDIPGAAGSRIYRCQTEICDAEKALQPVSAIIASNKDRTKLGLKNMSDTPWRVEFADGRTGSVEPKAVLPLSDGTELTVNSEKIHISANK